MREWSLILWRSCRIRAWPVLLLDFCYFCVTELYGQRVGRGGGEVLHGRAGLIGLEGFGYVI